MPIAFHGTLDELKDKILPLDIDGTWEPRTNGVWKLRCRNRAAMLWAETTGRIWFDGPQAVKAELETKIEGCLTNPAPLGSISAETKSLWYMAEITRAGINCA